MNPVMIQPDAPTSTGNGLAAAAAPVALPPDAAIAGLADLFAALADPTRLRLIAALAPGELSVGQLAATIGLSHSAVSHQLQLLRRLGLVRPRRDGRLVFYQLDDDHVLALYRQGLDHVAHGRAGHHGVGDGA